MVFQKLSTRHTRDLRLLNDFKKCVPTLVAKKFLKVSCLPKFNSIIVNLRNVFKGLNKALNGSVAESPRR